ncbi:MAG: pilus assembly protein [Actinomycetota bacterium]
MTVCSAPKPNQPGFDRGSADALGLAIIAPAIIGLALVLVFVGRAVDGRATTQSAAEAAAQAAAQERSPDAAQAAAQRVAAAMLVDSTSCAQPSVTLDTSRFEPGGIVSATVSCTATSADLGPLASSGSRRATATAFARIDPFRGVDP